MELLISILYFFLIWAGSGLLSVLLKMFVFFRGPIHMMTLYLSHPKTRDSALLLLDLAKRNDPDHIVRHISIVSLVAGAIFAPLAILDLILDVCRFTNYTPPKQGLDNEQK